jgi:hypothetical protein
LCKATRRATGAGVGRAAWRAQDQIDGRLIDRNYDADVLVIIAPAVDLLIDPWLYAAFVPALFAVYADFNHVHVFAFLGQVRSQSAYGKIRLSDSDVVIGNILKYKSGFMII